MNISTKIRYGLRAMIEIANAGDKKPVVASFIAENQKLSKKYLEHLLNMLKIAGFIKSVRGSKGGYVLCVPPEKITLHSIFVALEGPIELVNCVNPENNECCEKGCCLTHKFWMNMTKETIKYLSERTLKDIMDDKFN